MHCIGVLNTFMQCSKACNTKNYNVIRKLRCLFSEYWWTNDNFGVCVCSMFLNTYTYLCSYYVFYRRSYRLHTCFWNIRNTEALVCDASLILFWRTKVDETITTSTVVISTDVINMLCSFLQYHNYNLACKNFQIVLRLELLKQ